VNVTSPWRRWWAVQPGSSLFFDCIVAWTIALIGSVLVVLVVHSLSSSAGVDISTIQKPAVELKPRNFWITVLATPIIETVVLGLLLRLLQVATQRRQLLAVLSALAWGAAHACFYPLWFFGTVWSFYVFSRGWLAWQPVSYKHAFGAAALPHALVTSSALAMQFFANS
jgi:hypothetical protein